jgi:hypothetical protein
MELFRRRQQAHGYALPCPPPQGAGSVGEHPQNFRMFKSQAIEIA